MANYWYNTVTKETFIEVLIGPHLGLVCLEDGTKVANSTKFGSDSGDYAERNFVKIKNIEISFDIVQPTRHTVRIEG